MSRDLQARYLERWAEPETRSLPASLTNLYDCCLVIPARAEPAADLMQTWSNLPDNWLVIVVANAPDSLEAQSVAMLANLREASNAISATENLEHRQMGRHNLLLVDRVSQPIPPNRGVGLARKIGCDLALALINAGLIKQPFIFNSDADVVLPESYANLNLEQDDPDTAALVFPFRHQPGDFPLPTVLYETSLFYYVYGLHYAGSPYAHLTVGSTLVISARHYVLVRGFPQRNAGEDFYLLNKLAKTGRIRQLAEPQLSLSARLSERVVFGTGPGIRSISELENPLRDYRFYHPEIFECLKSFLSKLKTIREAEDLPAHINDPVIADWCDKQGLFKLVQSKHGQSGPVLDKSLHDWMDGFRTLRLVHHLRASGYPSLPLAELAAHPLLRQFPFGGQPEQFCNALRAQCTRNLVGTC